MYDIFGTLAAGGTLVLPDPRHIRDPAHWLRLAEREGPDRVQRLAPGTQVISLGGATEASIWSVCYPIEETDPTWASIPYGKPLANQRLYVLDRQRRPRPDWVPGETRLPRELADLAQPRFTRLAGAIGADDWSRLKQLAASRNLTPSGLLCAAFADVLAMWGQCPEFTINLTTFDRQPLHPDVGRWSATSPRPPCSRSTPARGRLRPVPRSYSSRYSRTSSTVSSAAWKVFRRLRTVPSRRADVLTSVVFTSMLIPEPSITAPGRPWDAEPVYGVSQTPQVLLDHQVYEHDGTLRYSWDHVREAFPGGMVEAIFEAYGNLLRSAQRGLTDLEEEPMETDEVDVTYRVVLNDEEQYSIWPVDREIPAGWRDEGTSGTKDECLAHIDQVWTDMRPLSLR